MARKKADEPVVGDNIQARILSKLSKDKALGGVVKRASGSLFSDTPYYISTQSAMLDYAIGQPGVPAGKLTTIFGREGGGKSTLAQHLLAETQRVGGIAVYIDSEQRFDRTRAGRLGLNVDDLILIDGATMEQAFDAIEKVIDGVREEAVDVPVMVVYDSLAGAPLKKQLEAEMGDVIVGKAAALVGAVTPRLKLKISTLGVALVIVNQIRSRVQFVDPRSPSTYERIKVMGKEHTMIAEWPLIFHSALMLYVNSISTTGEKDAPTGIRARAIVRKCGIAPREMWQAEFDIDYLTGIDRTGSKFELLERLKIIEHTSAGWYAYTDSDRFGSKKFMRKAFVDELAEHPELEQIIREAPTKWQTET